MYSMSLAPLLERRLRKLRSLLLQSYVSDTWIFWTLRQLHIYQSVTRLVVPKNQELRKKILDEAHLSRFSIHPGSRKMYQDLKQRFWWTRMKREIARYIAECDVCQRVKADHLKYTKPIQPLAIP